MNKNKKWSGRFNEPVAKLVKEYTASINFDKRLALYDIEGSLAHAKMLNKIGVLADDDLEKIISGMKEIISDIKNNKLDWSLELEDVHMNIESELTKRIGDSGKKLHTGRSRNDQVATDIRLWLRDEIDDILNKINLLQKSLLVLAKKNINVVMPGFTHLQVAQPVSFAHHILAYISMFSRDYHRLIDCRKRVNCMPLGAAALAGTTYPIDRNITRELLNFEKICENSLDAVSDRDFLIEFLSCASIMMVHFSRISEELILWMNPSFGFITLEDKFCTGSSIMPQKKNPDVPELVRGKTGRVVGHLMTLLMLMKAQPLAYNKDNQEDKEPVFDAVDTISNTLNIYTDMVSGIIVNEDNMLKALKSGYATATDLADYLVKKGLPFRDSHEVVAKIVKLAEEKSCELDELNLDEMKKYSKLIDKDIFEHITLIGSINSRNHLGGTAINQIEIEIAKWNKLLNE